MKQHTENMSKISSIAYLRCGSIAIACSQTGGHHKAQISIAKGPLRLLLLILLKNTFLCSTVVSIFKHDLLLTSYENHGRVPAETGTGYRIKYLS